MKELDIEMSELKIKQISNSGSLPNSYIAFNGSKNVWQKIHHTAAFTALDLSEGVLSVEHELGRKYVHVAIYDEDDCQVVPDQIKVFDEHVEITLTSYQDFPNEWVVVVT